MTDPIQFFTVTTIVLSVLYMSFTVRDPFAMILMAFATVVNVTFFVGVLTAPLLTVYGIILLTVFTSIIMIALRIY